jgi:hypothetical protein
LNNVLQFLFIAGYQPYFIVRTIHHAFHGVEDCSRPVTPERLFLPVTLDGIPQPGKSVVEEMFHVPGLAGRILADVCKLFGRKGPPVNLKYRKPGLFCHVTFADNATGGSGCYPAVSTAMRVLLPYAVCHNLRPLSAMKTRAGKMKPKRYRKKKTMAESADRHVLYEKSVQNVTFEYKFVNKTFRKLRGRRPRHIREDFCGTANMCCEWVRRGKGNTAIGVDLDPEVLTWGREHNLSRLKPDARLRVSLIQEDVCKVKTEKPVDVVLAMNFSYQLFLTRKKLGDYFRKVRKGLAEDGILFMDAFGGYEAYQEIREKRKYKGFKYIWEHARYNPIDGSMICHIHFGFPDGSKMKQAFTYEWRLWSLPELRELLDEAGFSKVTVYWEETDPKTGEGTDVYSPATVGDSDPGWVCFIVAEK